MNIAFGRRFGALIGAVALAAGSLTIAVGVVTAPPAAATHFRASQLTWLRSTATSRTVTFDYDGAFRRSFFGAPNVGNTVAIGAPIVFGDGTQSPSIVATVDTVDAANDTITVHADITHAYGGTATTFTASFESCCRLSAPQHINNPDRGLRTETRVSLAPGVTASPDSAISPIVDCPINALCQFFLPATDADHGTLSWVFATSAQAGGNTSGSSGPFTQPSGATVSGTTGLYSWNTSGQTLNPSGNSYFSTQVIVTKTIAGGATSTVAVDFFLRVTSAASTNHAPKFDGATPADGTVINVPINNPVTFDVHATDPDAGATVTMGMLGKPAAATYTTVSANPGTGHFSWTPTAVGNSILTVTAQDEFGLQATQRSITIHAGDNVPPVVSVPSDMTIEATGPSGTVATYTASALDNVDGPIAPTCARPSGATFPLGTTTVTCTATDASGNTGTASFSITVKDTTGPAISGLDNLTVEAQDGNGAAVTFAPTAVDLVDGSRPVICSPASGSTFGLGTTLVTCKSTDTRGNSSIGSFRVLVQDTTRPVLSLPADITAEATSAAGAVVTYSATAADAVDGPIAPQCSPASGSTFALGDTTVSCTATDANGNAALGSFTVHVVDTTAPVLTVPGDITVEADGPGGTAVSYAASALDIVDGNIAPACTAASGSVFSVGSTPITCTATDAHGNQSTDSFKVIVLDTTPPSVVVPADITAEATGAAGAVVPYTATAIDLVDGPMVPNCSTASGATFALGDTTVTCTATDAHGNLGSSAFVVHVVDTTPPALTAPAGVSVEADSPGGANVPFTVTAVDLVDGNVAVTCAPPSGSLFPIGTTIVSCSATDAHGNAGITTLPVTVTDTTPPALHLPGNLTAEATGPTGATVSYPSSATDIVDGAVAASCSPASGGIFALGHTAVLCSAVDSHGNRSTEGFDVFVDDTTPPVITVPADVTVEATGPNGAAVTYNSPSAHDTVDGDIAAFCDRPSGGTFSVGTTNVICGATDAHGNRGENSFNVIVHDTTSPVVTVPADIVAEATGPAGAVVGYPAATAVDTVDGPRPVNCTPGSGTQFALGQTTVTCWASDTSGNVGVGSFSVTVRDTAPPVVTAPVDIVVEATGPSGAAVTYPHATAKDVVDGTVTTSCSPPSGSVFAVGVTTVTCSATDAHGNTGSATFRVTVRDTTAPRLTLPANVVAEATSPAGAAVGYTATALDLVDGAIAPLCSPASGSTFAMGVTTVACSATDAHNNVSKGSFTVTVRDTLPPVITWSGNQGTYTVDQVVNITCAATDSGSGIASSTCQNVSGPASSFALGLNTFTANATDRAGNSSTASTSFTVAVTADSLCALTMRYETKADVANSMCVKIRNGAAAAARGDKSGANTALVNYQNEASAQSAKSMTAAQAATLIRLAKALAATW